MRDCTSVHVKYKGRCRLVSRLRSPHLLAPTSTSAVPPQLDTGRLLASRRDCSFVRELLVRERRNIWIWGEFLHGAQDEIDGGEEGVCREAEEADGGGLVFTGLSMGNMQRRERRYESVKRGVYVCVRES
jgi:hypothetical protein